MSPRTKIILNPYANRWQAGRLETDIRAALDAVNIAFDLERSTAPGDCQTIAAQATQAGYDRIVAAGGDGTLGEVINGILSDNSAKTQLPKLGVIPVGTANDFVANLGLNPSLSAAATRLQHEHVHHIDACALNGHYFINNAGLGLEPHITALQQQMRGVSGIFRYLLATFIGISQNPQWEMKLVWDGGEYSGPATLISIGNGARTGGLFYTVPSALPDDGMLTFICGSIPTRLGILKAFPSILKSGPGNIAEHPSVAQHHCTRLHVETNRPTFAHTDGELLPQQLQEATFEIWPGRIPVLID